MRRFPLRQGALTGDDDEVGPRDDQLGRRQGVDQRGVVTAKGGLARLQRAPTPGTKDRHLL